MTDKVRDPSPEAREYVDPEERIRPMPLIPAIVAIGMVVWGLVYIVVVGPIGPSEYGDHRTLADLRGAAGGDGAGGGAVDGASVFAANCVACHQAAGTGLPGVFPPLAGSEWVNGEGRVVANILLHGITGDIEVLGNHYAGTMPTFDRFSDAEIAAVVSFIRSSWGNHGDPIDAALVEAERAAARRSGPFGGGADLTTLRDQLAAEPAGGSGEPGDAGASAEAEDPGASSAEAASAEAEDAGAPSAAIEAPSEAPAPSESPSP